MLARLTLLLLALLMSGCAGQACEVSARAVIPLQFLADVPMATVLIDGKPARMVVDTGAGRTTLSLDGVQRLGLPLDPWVGTTLRGVGGIERHQNTAPHSVRLGTLDLRQPGLLGGFSLSVASLPSMLTAVDGLLGRDLLGAYDLDLDFAQSQFTLYDVSGCSGRFLPWRQPYRGIATLPDYRQAMVFLTTLDGHPLRTMIDSGSGQSMLTAPGVFHAGQGVIEGRPATIVGVGPERLSGQIRQYAVLGVAGVVTTDPRLLTTNMRFPLDMLLGADWLASHRVWISFATGQIFVAEP